MSLLALYHSNRLIQATELSHVGTWIRMQFYMTPVSLTHLLNVCIFVHMCTYTYKNSSQFSVICVIFYTCVWTRNFVLHEKLFLYNLLSQSHRIKCLTIDCPFMSLSVPIVVIYSHGNYYSEDKYYIVWLFNFFMVVLDSR